GVAAARAQVNIGNPDGPETTALGAFGFRVERIRVAEISKIGIHRQASNGVHATPTERWLRPTPMTPICYSLNRRSQIHRDMTALRSFFRRRGLTPSSERSFRHGRPPPSEHA